MYSNKSIVDNAVASRDHTTLVAAVKAAGLADTLGGPGPFTVFAPTNAAFRKLPASAVETLVSPNNLKSLTAILTYHVVPGALTSNELYRRINADGGRATLATLQGERLTLTLQGGRLTLIDTKGGRAAVTVADVRQSNGVVFVIDAVLIP